jgi:hypothetical protein
MEQIRTQEGNIVINAVVEQGRIIVLCPDGTGKAEPITTNNNWDYCCLWAIGVRESVGWRELQ